MDTSYDTKHSNYNDKPDQRQLSVTSQNLQDLPKSRWERSWPTIACGAGLFSDGYLNG